MSKKYFPGANTGCGFISRFSGIVPPDEKKHYTFVLKGGPGVGKNTLMRTVASHAHDKGMTVEEFRCASDPESFDALRIVETGTVLLDGTAPHSIDPYMPGIKDEVIDLGHFKNKKEFAKREGEVARLMQENKVHYREAYAMLSAARSIKNEAFYAAKEALDIGKLHTFLSPFISSAANGKKRELFAASATPNGVIDFSDSFKCAKSICLSGILGEVALGEAVKLLDGKTATIGYGFVEPAQPIAILSGEISLSLGEGETLIGLCHSPLSTKIPSLLEESERLTEKALAALAGALDTHDKIEEIYRPYVDYDRVNEECEKLLRELEL